VSLFSRVALGLATFLGGAGIVYGVTSKEYVGTTFFLVAAGGFALIGLFVRRAVRASASGADEREAEEPHVTATIWPFVLSLAGVGLVLGAVVAKWLFVVGGALFVAAAVGWFTDVSRQWGHDRRG
jgi:hypothetical protein